MKKTWIEIKGKLSEHSPEISESFNNPATQDEISHLETAIGQKLPDSFVSYLLTFNGQNHKTSSLIHSHIYHHRSWTHNFKHISGY